MTELTLFAIALTATYFGVAVFRRWSLHNGVLDVPNARSSHDTPVPRGAGIVIVAISLLLYTYITIYLTNDFKLYYVAAAGLVAFISWLDDLYSLSSMLRLLVHVLAAAILIWGSGLWQEIFVPGFDVPLYLGIVDLIIAFIWIVWMVNAYNFMDGIDGLAGSQAIVAGIAWLIFGYWFGYETAYYFGGVIAFSSIGFLIHNWSPARVFMGDVGSAFLGLTFAALPLMKADAGSENSALIYFAGVSFVWFFLFDTVFTFIRRVLRREKVWTAHREHIYQRMIIEGKSHSSITLIYAGFTGAVAASLFIGLRLGGSWKFLVVFTIVLLSTVLFFCSTRKKGLT